MENICFLFDLAEGEVGVVFDFVSLEKRKRKRLIELGFVCGEKVTILKKTKNLAIVGIRGFSLCLDRVLAGSIRVQKGARA